MHGLLLWNDVVISDPHSCGIFAPSEWAFRWASNRARRGSVSAVAASGRGEGSATSHISGVRTCGSPSINAWMKLVPQRGRPRMNSGCLNLHLGDFGIACAIFGYRLEPRQVVVDDMQRAGVAIGG